MLCKQNHISHNTFQIFPVTFQISGLGNGNIITQNPDKFPGQVRIQKSQAIQRIIQSLSSPHTQQSLKQSLLAFNAYFLNKKKICPWGKLAE